MIFELIYRHFNDFPVATLREQYMVTVNMCHAALLSLAACQRAAVKPLARSLLPNRTRGRSRV